MPAILSHFRAHRTVPQIFRNINDFTRMIQANTYSKAKELLDIVIRPEFQPFAQKAWNSTNCTFDRHRGKYRDPKPCLGEKAFCKRTTHQACCRILLEGKDTCQDAGPFAFAFAGMQLHDQFAPCGQRSICARRPNIPTELFWTSTRHIRR